MQALAGQVHLVRVVVVVAVRLARERDGEQRGLWPGLPLLQRQHGVPRRGHAVEEDEHVVLVEADLFHCGHGEEDVAQVGAVQAAVVRRRDVQRVHGLELGLHVGVVPRGGRSGRRGAERVKVLVARRHGQPAHAPRRAQAVPRLHRVRETRGRVHALRGVAGLLVVEAGEAVHLVVRCGLLRVSACVGHVVRRPLLVERRIAVRLHLLQAVECPAESVRARHAWGCRVVRAGMPLSWVRSPAAPADPAAPCLAGRSGRDGLDRSVSANRKRRRAKPNSASPAHRCECIDWPCTRIRNALRRDAELHAPARAPSAAPRPPPERAPTAIRPPPQPRLPPPRDTLPVRKRPDRGREGVPHPSWAPEHPIPKWKPRTRRLLNERLNTLHVMSPSRRARGLLPGAGPRIKKPAFHRPIPGAGARGCLASAAQRRGRRPANFIEAAG
ncbi:hypothetical protein DFJ74DRAFT_326909 [Hyaloraphidium curvatum]|nr:hypothetical protein DFJ74DRAFT_326909 [Hyaloraphidium curvatum]